MRMRTQLISSLFMAIEGLDEAFTRAVGYEAMDEHQGNDLLKMVHACTQACNDALLSRPGAVPHVPPAPGMVTPDETKGMDDTMTFDFSP